MNRIIGQQEPRMTKSVCLGTRIRSRTTATKISRSVAVNASSNRSVVILPGLGNNAADYDELALELTSSYGYQVHVASVSRLDWAKNARGLLDTNYWRGTLNPRPTVDWYLERVGDAVEKAKLQNTSGPITLLAHSAGGWLGRLYMYEFERQGIDRFVSLGSPHLPPPKGVIDQTRGILTYISNTCPGAYHDDISYVTIAGKFVRGANVLGPGTISARVVGAGYKQVCGEAEVYGDGVVPIPSAHLEGAMQVELEGVYHSPLGSTKISEEDAIRYLSYLDSDDYDDQVDDRAARRRWYGCRTVLPQWVEYISTDKVASPAMNDPAL